MKQPNATIEFDIMPYTSQSTKPPKRCVQRCVVTPKRITTSTRAWDHDGKRVSKFNPYSHSYALVKVTLDDGTVVYPKP